MAHLHVHAQEMEGVLVLLSANSLTALGTAIFFETGHAIFRYLDTCAWICSNKCQWSVIIPSRC